MLLDRTGTPFPESALRTPPLTPRADSPYQATQRSDARGFLWTFQEDTRRQLSSSDRITMMLKSRTLFENTGVVKALYHLARMVGSVRPQSISGDPTWSTLAEAAFDRVAYSPLIFDAGGRWAFDTLQVFANFRRMLDGDSFAILTETTEGRARVAMREAHCVASPMGVTGEWFDGVRTNGDGFPLGYGFRDMGKIYGGKVREFDARSVHHWLTITTEGGTRGTPAAAHFLDDAQDLQETKAFLKMSIKIAASMALAPKNNTPGALPDGIGAGVEFDPYAPPDDPVTAAARPEQAIATEDVFGGGVVASRPLEVLTDSRPHPNAMAFRESILREAAIGLGVPPSILYFLDDPGGSTNRIQIDMFARFVLDQYRSYLLPFAQRYWTYCIAKEMKAGRLPYPSKGEFWHVRWTLPRSLTADPGRLGRLSIELRKALMTTYARHFEELGFSWEDEVRQCAVELRYLKDLETEFNFAPGELTNALLPTNVAPLAAADANADTGTSGTGKKAAA